MAIVACVLPGQAVQPAPGMDPNAVATAVEGTAQAAAHQTAAAQPVPTRRTGTIIEQLEDGTTRYSDYDAGFEIIFPDGWLPVRPHSEEFNAALAKEGKANPMLRNYMEFDLAEYTAFDRLYAYILRPDIEKNVLFGFTYLEWLTGDSVPIDSLSLQKEVQRVESAEGLPAFHADTAQLLENNNDVSMMEIGGPSARNNGQGEFVTFYATIIYFKPAPDSIVRILFGFFQEYQFEIAPDVDFIIQSVIPIEP